MSRATDRVSLDPGNPWAWYELCKATGARNETTLVALTGASELPAAAIEGLVEFTGREITPLKGACQ